MAAPSVIQQLLATHGTLCTLKAWTPDTGLSACISQLHDHELIDPERPPILCAEANGGREL